MSEHLLQRSTPFTYESLDQLFHVLRLRSPATPHLRPHSLLASVCGNETVSVYFCENKPAIIPAPIRGWISVDTAFCFVQTFGTIIRDCQPLLECIWKPAHDGRRSGIIPERIVACQASQLCQKTVGVHKVNPWHLLVAYLDSSCAEKHVHAAVIGCVISGEPSVAKTRSTRRSSAIVLMRCSFRA